MAKAEYLGNGVDARICIEGIEFRRGFAEMRGERERFREAMNNFSLGV